MKPPITAQAYIQSWIKKLRGDKKLAITAAQVQKAADYILNHKPRLRMITSIREGDCCLSPPKKIPCESYYVIFAFCL